MGINIENGSVILFQGDSITDCGRIKDKSDDLGNGYPLTIASMFAAMYPHKQVTFINRGISGNRVKDLEGRWMNDCINLKPDVVSILIGINDCWRRYDSNDSTSADQYQKTYRRILTQVREKLKARILMLEPFLLPVTEEKKEWRVDLDPKIHAARELAREFADIYIPLDGILSSASIHKSCQFWTADGVHPTAAGHALITKAWLDAIGLQ